VQSSINAQVTAAVEELVALANADMLAFFGQRRAAREVLGIEEKSLLLDVIHEHPPSQVKKDF